MSCMNHSLPNRTGADSRDAPVQMLSGPGAKAAAGASLVAAYLPRMCSKDGLCPAWRPGGSVNLHDVTMSR